MELQLFELYNMTPTVHNTIGARGMDIGFVWDEDKYHQVRREHNVQFYEVVAAFLDPNGYEDFDSQEHEDRWMQIGITPGGRILSIICTTEEDSQIYRLITAFEATERFVNEYYRRIGI